MSLCPSCQTPGAYIGFLEIECVSLSCRHVSKAALAAHKAQADELSAAITKAIEQMSNPQYWGPGIVQWNHIPPVALPPHPGLAGWLPDPVVVTDVDHDTGTITIGAPIAGKTVGQYKRDWQAAFKPADPGPSTDAGAV
jgi:hypothetical protein